MTTINCVSVKSKIWYQASQIIELLGYENINTSNYIKNHIPEKNRLQIDGRNTWFVDSYGMAIILMQGVSTLSIDTEEMARNYISELITRFCNETMGYDLSIDVDLNKPFAENFPIEVDNVANLVS